MTLKIEIVDGAGRGNKAKVNGEGELTATIHDHPPLDEAFISYPFRQYFTDDGMRTGSNNMIVSTAQDFYISASQTVDIFIKSVSIRIGDSSTSLDKFGGLTALTNGCDFLFRNDSTGEVTIADELKTNLSLLRLGASTGAVGTGLDAYLLDVSGGGTEDTYLPFIDFSVLFGYRYGIRLKKGSNDRVIFRINDNLTGLITFNAIAYGSQI